MAKALQQQAQDHQAQRAAADSTALELAAAAEALARHQSLLAALVVEASARKAARLGLQLAAALDLLGHQSVMAAVVALGQRHRALGLVLPAARAVLVIWAVVAAAEETADSLLYPQQSIIAPAQAGQAAPAMSWSFHSKESC